MSDAEVLTIDRHLDLHRQGIWIDVVVNGTTVTQRCVRAKASDQIDEMSYVSGWAECITGRIAKDGSGPEMVRLEGVVRFVETRISQEHSRCRWCGR